MKRCGLFFLLFVLTITGCGGPNDKGVEQDFLRANPTYTVIDCSPWDGNFDAVEYLIRYKKPNDNTVHEETWVYVKDFNNGNEWRIGSKRPGRPS